MISDNIDYEINTQPLPSKVLKGESLPRGKKFGPMIAIKKR
jgi:hypothetical protein